MDDFFKTGDEGFAHAQKVQEEAQRRFGTQRFWLKAGESAKVTFLDTVGTYFSEHELQLNGKWGNHFTCRSGFSECPLCDAGYKSTYVCAYTIIDHSSYTTKKGDVLKNQKKLLVLRPTVINKLARRRESCGGDLTYCVFSFARDKKEECRTGEDIQFVKRLKVSDVLKFKPKDSKMTDEEWLKPFNYRELFAPKSIEELRRLAGMPAPVGSSEHADAVLGEEAEGNTDGFLVEGSELASEDNLEDLL
jgi:hypothetical protein